MPEDGCPYTDTFLMSGAGSPRYMAPECLALEQYNLKADIYSFSIILWAILSASRPYSFVKSRKQLVQHVGKNIGRFLSIDFSSLQLATNKVFRIKLPQYKMAEDPRLTRTGLRKSKACWKAVLTRISFCARRHLCSTTSSVTRLRRSGMEMTED